MEESLTLLWSVSILASRRSKPAGPRLPRYAARLSLALAFLGRLPSWLLGAGLDRRPALDGSAAVLLPAFGSRLTPWEYFTRECLCRLPPALQSGLKYG